MTGQTLSHYQVLEKLGEGGMGVVYRALDTRLNRAVAIKVLPGDVGADPTRLERFLHEARAASALNHPNIITVYDLGTSRPRPSLDEASATVDDAASGGANLTFIAMEYVAGRTLAELLGGRKLQLDDALKYAIQIADALATAHAAGIVHRDLKPANVMVTEAGRVKVLDFGLAKSTEPADSDDAAPTRTSADRLGPQTEAGTILGTIAYMSPEQAEGRKVDARSDIFSFGALLYEMVSGQRPFRGETKLSTLAAILHEEPRPLNELAVGVPRELERLITHCLRKDPASRFQHLDDVRTLLEALKSDSAPRPPASMSDGLRPSRRSIATTAAGLGVAIAAGAIAFWYLGRDSTTQTPEPQPAATTASAPDRRPRLSTGGPASSDAEANRYFETAMQANETNDVARARTMIERALQLDPRFAEARAWYGFSNWLLLDQGISNDNTLLYQAEDLLRQALQDDPTLARAHASFAAVYMMQGRKELVPAAVGRALETNPADLDASQFLLLYHQYQGDYATAKLVGQDGLKRNPLFFPNRMVLGEIFRQEGNYPEAIREQERVLEQDPTNVYSITYLARTFIDSGDLGGARNALDRVRPADRQNHRVGRARAMLLARQGRRANALEEMNEGLLKWERLIAYETAEAAEFFALVGDTEQAIEWLDLAVRNGDERAEWFRRDPLLAGIRSHPRFEQILQSIEYRRQQRK